jgi:phosphatidylglycerophosphate synthase
MNIPNPVLLALKKIAAYIPSSVSPNTITLLNFILINILCISTIYKNPAIFSGSLFLYWIIDTLDGIHAKNTNQITKFGGILDQCIDVYSILLITYMLIHLYLPHFSNTHLYKFILGILYLVDIPFLLRKYSIFKFNGIRFLRSTDILLLLTLLPILKYFTVSQLFISYTLKIFAFILFMYILILTFNLTITSISVFDIILLIGLCCLYFIKNIYIIAFINSLYIMYLCYSKLTPLQIYPYN